MTLVPLIFALDDQKGVSRTVDGTRTNHVILFRNCRDSTFIVKMNNSLRKLVVMNCENCRFQIWDSVVINTQEIDLVDCKDIVFTVDETDLRHWNVHNVRNLTLQISDSDTLIENFVFLFHGPAATGLAIERTIIKPGSNPNNPGPLPVVVIAHENLRDLSGGDKVLVANLPDGKHVKAIEVSSDISKEEAALVFASAFPRLRPSSSAAIDAERLAKFISRTVQNVHDDIAELERQREIFRATADEVLHAAYQKELEEVEDSQEDLVSKVKQVAAALRAAKHAVVYTGAGVSTAANLPDYRGPQGVWTVRKRLAQAKKDDSYKRLDEVYPTYAHYAIATLVHRGIFRFVISTNLDGLHRRSGIPREKISELHGNCYKEVCERCNREYLRSFNTLETRTDRWTHLTGRYCDCGGALKDTIIHFSENIAVSEWEPAVVHARKSDVALVLGTSMHVQPAASLPDKVLNNDGSLFIVNLQNTPYDRQATLTIHSKTDDFMHLLLDELGLQSEVDDSFDLRDHLLVRETEVKRRKQYMIACAVAVAVAIGVAAFLRFRRA